MKVLFVSSGNKKNGINPIVFRQGESLEKEGLNMEYFYIAGKGLPGYLRNIFTLRNLLNKGNFTIIHAHYGLCGIVCLLAKRKEKLVVSFMGDDILGSRNDMGKRSLLGNIFVSINQFAAKFYDFIIVKSQEMKSQLNNLSDKIQVIPNGVDIDLFYPVEKKKAIEVLNWGHMNINLIFLSDPGRPEKNFTLASKAVEHLKRKFKNLCLHVITNQPAERLKYYYSASDVLLLPSFHEGSPNVIKEAMSCNCLVVATDVGDIKWLFGSTHGYYLSDFDVVHFSEAIEEAIKYSIHAKERQGRNRIVELALDSKDVAKLILVIYQKQL
ncbi:MAG: glycosyltransferase family 4 protein [Bacteroidota bacterium]